MVGVDAVNVMAGDGIHPSSDSVSRLLAKPVLGGGVKRSDEAPLRAVFRRSDATHRWGARRERPSFQIDDE